MCVLVGIYFVLWLLVVKASPRPLRYPLTSHSLRLKCSTGRSLVKNKLFRKFSCQTPHPLLVHLQPLVKSILILKLASLLRLIVYCPHLKFLVRNLWSNHLLLHLLLLQWMLLRRSNFL
jgi:hypothetical protein